MADTDITAVVAAATGTIMPDMVVVTATALVVVAVGIIVTTKEGVISHQGTIPEHCQCRSSKAITQLPPLAAPPPGAHHEGRDSGDGGSTPAGGKVEVVLTLLFNLLLLVFLVKLLVAMFSTKLAVILLYLAILIFAMALSGRFPGGEFL
ncbi:hypothetical protein ZWY2020_057791 [Hordeum vulgare]|nr:hypothetical protein ZWY2020_057791 [Hordeum vulgare]